MNKIFIYIFVLMLMSISVSATAGIYPTISQDYNIQGIDYYDGNIYILGTMNFTLGNISSFGYYNPITDIYTQRDSLSTGGIISTYASDGRLGHYIDSQKEVLCYTSGFSKCYRYSSSINKWVEVLSTTAGYYGQTYSDSIVSYPFNIVSVNGKGYEYNNTAGTMTDKGSNDGKYILKTNYEFSSLYGVDNSASCFIYDSNPLIVDFNCTSTGGTTPNPVVDGWRDETHYYLISSTDIYTSSDGITYSQVASSTCGDLTSLSGVSLRGMDCQSSGNCLIGGEYNTNELLTFFFDGENCQIDTQLKILGDDLNVSVQRTLEDVDYDSATNKYYVGGYNLFGYIRPEVIIGDSSTGETEFSVNFSDNYYIKFGNTVYTDSNKRTDYYKENGIIYTYPTNFVNDFSQLTFTINSTQNGYYKLECDNTVYDSEVLATIDFDDCSNTAECGFFPYPSVYQWNTDNISSFYGQSLILYNDTYSFGKYRFIPEAYASDYFRFKISYDYMPDKNSSVIFSIISPYNYELINVLMNTSDTNICYYQVNNSVTLGSPELLFCDDISFTIPTINSIYFNSPDKDWYIVSDIDSQIHTSDTKDSLDINYGFSGIKLTTFITEPNTWIDNIEVSGITNDIIMNYASIPKEIYCFYNIGQCYTTKIYFSFEENDFTSFKEYNICGEARNTTLAESSTQFEETGTVNCEADIDCIVSQMSLGVKLAYGLVFILLTIIVMFFIGSSVNMPQLGFQIGLILSFFELIVMSIPSFPVVGGFIPLWIIVSMILIIVVVFSFSIVKRFTEGNQQGGQQ